MGMPVTIEILDPGVRRRDMGQVFAFFAQVDRTFSPDRETSGTSLLDRGVIKLGQASPEMRTLVALAEETHRETGGYFNVVNNGHFNPVGIVKGWAIDRAAKALRRRGFSNFYVEAGGDTELCGKNRLSQDWEVGIRNPFVFGEVVKVLRLSGRGVATSGTYARGAHIYNPLASDLRETDRGGSRPREWSRRSRDRSASR